MIIQSSFNGSLSNFSKRWWTIYFKYKCPNMFDKLFWNCRLSTDIIICQVVLLCTVYTELPFTFCSCILGFEIIISCDSLFEEWHIWIKKVRFKPLHQHTSWLAPWTNQRPNSKTQLKFIKFGLRARCFFSFNLNLIVFCLQIQLSLNFSTLSFKMHLPSKQ